MKQHAPFRKLQSMNRFALFIISGITSGDKHYSCDKSFINFNFSFSKISFSYSLNQFKEITFNSWYYYFRFRITQSDVIFNHVWVSLYIYQTEENKSFINYSISR